MTFDPHIPDTQHYVTEMSKPLIDKLFFIDKVEADLFVDYGCADGILLNALRRFSPDVPCVGYDASLAMIELCRTSADENTVFTEHWDTVRERVLAVRATGGKSCVILSSLIHEVYAYLNPGEIAEFWKRIWGGDGEPGFDVVCIRDMMVGRAASRPSDPVAVARVRQLYSMGRLAEWEGRWGNLSENWSMIHFLLTYRYDENWDREVRENYLPMQLEEFLHRVPREYSPIYTEHFVPPFLRRQVRRDFSVELADPTHYKVIFEKSS